jgi:hypothetical protein
MVFLAMAPLPIAVRITFEASLAGNRAARLAARYFSTPPMTPA